MEEEASLQKCLAHLTFPPRASVLEFVSDSGSQIPVEELPV